MTKKRKLTAICILLCLFLLTLVLSFTGLNVFATESQQVIFGENVSKITVLYNGASETSVRLDEDGKETLVGHITGTESTRRSWQILTPDGTQWVNISGKTQETLSVSYALVGSMLNEKNRAYVRCTLTDGDELYYSEPVEIVLSYRAGETIAEEKPSLMMFAASPYAATPMAEGEFKNYTIVINYIFDNGGLAFEPYGASVASGSDFKASIPSPTVVGYKPFRRIGDSYVEADTVELDYTNVTQDITINVIYEPAMVEFSVHHHLQSLVGDDYSLQADRITKGKGLTGSIVPDGLALTEDELPGFKALAYEKLEVAADGSTVVEIRYDRNYYLVQFDMLGGYGSEPIYTRYGAKVGVNNPIRHGYLFDGWELVSYGGQTPSTAQQSMYDINTAQITVPNANLVYRARWITQLTTYSMVFWGENIDDNKFSYWGHLENLQSMSGSFVNGEDRVDEIGRDDLDHFTYNDVLTDKNVLVEGDGSTIVNVYYTRNRYTITFKAKGLCTIPEGHTHGEDCYTTVCMGGHVHDESCTPTLVCSEVEHTAHTQACVICGNEEHTHTSACCGITEHTHTKACWNNVGNASTPNGAPTRNLEDGYIYRRIFSYYIYIKGTWYAYNGWGASSGDIVDPTCGYEEHTHGSADCNCDKQEHSHIDTCYKDVLHAHDQNACYTYECGMKAHEHVDGCYVLECGIPTGHSHSNTCRSASSVNTVKLVTVKYQKSLNHIWPITDDNGVTYGDGERWKPTESSTYADVLVYISDMPGEDFTLTSESADHSPYTMNYYKEVLPGEPYTKTYNGKNFILDFTVKARYNYITKAEDFFDINGYEQWMSDPAFNGNQYEHGDEGCEVDFYYTRVVTAKLQFRSNGVILTDKTQTGIMYGASLKEYYFEPDYPATLEPNAFAFGGWYTSPGHYDGTEVDWDTVTMSAGDVMYYAKWAPVTHTVRVYLTNDLTQEIGTAQYIAHGELALAPTETVSNGNYIFQGWFYVDEDGEQKPFLFNGIPVLHDLNVYALWSSHVSVNYTIHYVLFETQETIAPDTVGSAIAGHNKTFMAKAGTELNVGYQEGYYPLTNSHTVTMSAESDHEYTFEYVYVESMPYLVRYIDENGNPVAAQKEVVDNNLSVVTETFVKVDKMMPDAYQKRLVLAASGDDSDNDGIKDINVITFRYQSDEEHAYYRVVHYIQNIATNDYREYRSEETVGIIGTTYTVEPITLTGFAFNGALTKVNGVAAPVETAQVSAKLTGEGLLIEMYYDRVNVSYTVHYLENGTNKVLHTPKTEQSIFGAQVVEYAPGLTHKGYTLVGDNVKDLSLSMHDNVINFYYQETIYSLKYQIVGMDGCGSLSIQSENIAAVTGTPNGSTPMVAAGYHFVGWYLDAACMQAVDESWVDENTLRLLPQTDGIWLSNATYYAKFDPDFTTLTITTLGAQDIDEDQAFIFRVQGASEDGKDVDITVTVIGNGSVTVSKLLIGEYTVTQLSSWSYRYQPDSESKTVALSVDATKNTVTFSEIRVQTKWLDDQATQLERIE
ncbi:MAG: InlB B-repeat-containing protein [Clostridia bacterium]|nr:InlB B-repeat-containing protein [Clostridia bacterium]